MSGVTEYHAHGKLLIAGEYLVLAGATALALPVRFGQTMTVEPSEGTTLSWKSRTPGGTWFSGSFDTARNFLVLEAGKRHIATSLRRILVAVRKLNPSFLAFSGGWNVTVTANYPTEWGLGSSSTLLALLAQWAGIDVFDLYRSVSNGSGYDIACATRHAPIFYRVVKGRPEIRTASPGAALRKNTWFAFTGYKQNSRREVNAFRIHSRFSDIDILRISDISEAMCHAETFGELISLADEHEFILGTILQRDPVATGFPDFFGTVKSLGAWGGDFIMFISGEEPEIIRSYLETKGFTAVFTYPELEVPV